MVLVSQAEFQDKYTKFQRTTYDKRDGSVFLSFKRCYKINNEICNKKQVERKHKKKYIINEEKMGDIPLPDIKSQTFEPVLLARITLCNKTYSCYTKFDNVSKFQNQVSYIFTYIIYIMNLYIYIYTV